MSFGLVLCSAVCHQYEHMRVWLVSRAAQCTNFSYESSVKCTVMHAFKVLPGCSSTLHFLL